MKPILFSTEMVRAILEGRKTQTRRVIKTAASAYRVAGEANNEGNPSRPMYSGGILRPRFESGDIFWVRETWREAFKNAAFGYEYRADPPRDTDDMTPFTWRPCIHMPKEAARIFLRVKDVWIERVQDISEDDAIAEGSEGFWIDKETGCWCSARDNFAVNIWNPINAKHGYSWESNPWVWATEFEQISKEEAYG